MNITLNLNKDFERTLEQLITKYGEEFAYLNGVHETQLDNSNFLAKFTNIDTLADATIDPNANANHKDLRSFVTEKNKPQDKIFGLSKIFQEIKQQWGLETARDWLEAEFSRAFYLNDAATSSSFFAYCWANSLERLAKEGLFFLHNYNNQAPKHLSTFFDDVIEFVSFLGNRQSGAVGLPDVLIWAYYFWKNDVATGYYIKDPDYYLRQCFQKFVFRLNQPFIRIDQSAFTNVSIFDREYIESLFGGTEFPDGSLAIEQVEEIVKVQRVFMDVVAEIRKEQMFTFPVLTISLLYKDGKFQDEETARWAAKHNLQWMDSNFFCNDDVGTLSNCCFAGDQGLYYVNEFGDTILTTFEQFVDNRLDKIYDGSQIITKLNGSDKIVDPNTGKLAPILAVTKLPNYHRKILEIELEDGSLLKVTPDQKLFDKNSGKLIFAQDILENPDLYDL